MRLRRPNAFSLIEVALALGLVAFALIGVLGALPLAMGSARYSIEQTRAASIANTLFASFRSQPFTKVYYLTGNGSSGKGAPVNLATDTEPATPGKVSARQIYATFTDGLATGEGVQFQSGPGEAEYAVALGFNNLPGTSPGSNDRSGAATPIAGMASQVEVAVYALDHPNDVYRYVSVIANRAQ